MKNEPNVTAEAESVKLALVQKSVDGLQEVLWQIAHEQGQPECPQEADRIGEAVELVRYTVRAEERLERILGKLRECKELAMWLAEDAHDMRVLLS